MRVCWLNTESTSPFCPSLVLLLLPLACRPSIGVGGVHFTRYLLSTNLPLTPGHRPPRLLTTPLMPPFRTPPAPRCPHSQALVVHLLRSVESQPDPRAVLLPRILSLVPRALELGQAPAPRATPPRQRTRWSSAAASATPDTTPSRSRRLTPHMEERRVRETQSVQQAHTTSQHAP